MKHLGLKKSAKRVFDYTGQRVNAFVVLKKMDKSVNHCSVYLCVCDCGTKFETHTGYMAEKYGCHECSKHRHYGLVWKSRRENPSLKPSRRTELSQLSPETREGGRGSHANNTVNAIKRNAKARSLAWNLNSVDVFRLIQKPCHYCGTPANFPSIRNGLDRVDNLQGYTSDNVVPCCKKCNIAKHTMSVDDFRRFIVGVYAHWAGV